MQRLRWLPFGVLLLVSVLASGSAAARTISFERAGAITLVTLGTLLFSAASIVTVSCPVTLTGTLSRGPIREEPGETLGSITRVTTTAERCAGGALVQVLGLPWRITFERTLVVLPYRLYDLGVRIESTAWELVTLEFLMCLDRGTLEGLVALAGENPYAVGLYRLNNSVLSRGNSFERLCPESVTATGLFSLAPEQTLTEA